MSRPTSDHAFVSSACVCLKQTNTKQTNKPNNTNKNRSLSWCTKKTIITGLMCYMIKRHLSSVVCPQFSLDWATVLSPWSHPWCHPNIHRHPSVPLCMRHAAGAKEMHLESMNHRVTQISWYPWDHISVNIFNDDITDFQKNNPWISVCILISSTTTLV